jgi:hypothetical protein
MLAAVNQIRAARGLGPVTAEAILPAERRAEGHSDYVQQFAIGCADIAVGLKDRKDLTS